MSTNLWIAPYKGVTKMNISELRKELNLVEDIFGDIEVRIYGSGDTLSMQTFSITDYFIEHVVDKFIMALDTYKNTYEEESNT
jgi:hypothetical protein